MANKVYPRGMVQAYAAEAMTKHAVSVAKQGNKEKAIETLQKTLGDKEDARARQVINYLLNPANAKDHPLKDLRERLKAKAPAKKAVAKTSARKSVKARKTSVRQAPQAEANERAAAA